MNVQQKSRISRGTGMALMMVSLVSSLAACSPDNDSAPKAKSNQAQEQEPGSTRPGEPTSPNTEESGADLLVAYEVVLDGESAIRISRGGQYEALKGQSVRRGFLEPKDVAWIQSSLLDFEVRYGRTGLQSASLECSQLAAVTVTPDAPASEAAPVTTPAEGEAATPVPTEGGTDPVVTPVVPKDWGIRAVRVQSLRGLAPVVFSRNESVRCLFQGLATEGFDAKFEDGLGQIVQRLVQSHVKVEPACEDAEAQLEQALASARSCQVDADCAWVDKSFQPVWFGETKFVTTDDCSGVASPVVGNAQLVSAYGQFLGDLHKKAVEACSASASAAAAATSCTEARGFQAADHHPACLAGSCVYGPMTWETLSTRPTR